VKPKSNPLTQEQLEMLRSQLEELIRRNIPANQQVQTQQLPV
jgi:hypothetical protein